MNSEGFREQFYPDMVEGQRPMSTYAPSLQVGPPAPVPWDITFPGSGLREKQGSAGSLPARAKTGDSALDVLFKGIGDF